MNLHLRSVNLIIGLIIIIFSWLVFSPVEAASLSQTKFQPGDSIIISGEGFGETPDKYSAVCFEDDTSCFLQESFTQKDKFNWSDDEIKLVVPVNIKTEGKIRVYIQGNDGYSQEKASLDYTVKPVITQITPEKVAKTSDKITIEGGGFGEEASKVWLGDREAEVLTWSNQKVEVEAPSKIEEVSYSVKISNNIGLRYRIDYRLSKDYTNDPHSYFQTYFDHLDLEKAWNETGETKEEVTVAVLDNGIYRNHPDLEDQVWTNQEEIANNNRDDDNNGYVDDKFGYNFLQDNNNIEETGSHGTMIASIIGATRNNREGISGFSNNIELMPLVVMDKDKKKVSTAKIIEAIRYAVDNGADVINLSFGTRLDSGYTEQFNEVMQYAYNQGVVVVVASGNGDPETDIGTNLNETPQSPVCNNQGKPLFLGVSSLDNLDIDTQGNKKTPWSNYGSECVNISAPGRELIGAISPNNNEISTIGENYGLSQGTSFSAPLVSGVAALLKSNNPELKNWEIIHRLIYTSQNIDRFNAEYQGELGGKLNAYQALTLNNLSSHINSISPDQVEPGEQVKLNVSGYLPELGIKIVNFDSKIVLDESRIDFKKPYTLTLDLPETINSGTYSVVLGYEGQEIDRLQDSLQVGEVDTSSTPSSDEEVSKSEFLNTEEELVTNIDEELVARLQGKILLQTQEQGQAWYVYPKDDKKYFLDRPSDAFEVMKKMGIGISETDFNDFENNGVPARLHGRILLRTERHGEAYYIEPSDGSMHFLDRPSDAFDIMRNLGLGISNWDLRQIEVGRI